MPDRVTRLTLSCRLLDQNRQKLGLKFRQIKAKLDGVLSKDYVVVDPRGVKHHRHEKMHRLKENFWFGFDYLFLFIRYLEQFYSFCL